MSEIPPTTNVGFIYSNMDWEQYTSHRPSYPPKLYQMVSHYHLSHGGHFGTALDVGGGIGIITREYLVENFGHVTLSDPSEEYTSQAKDAFASTTLPPKSHLSFVTRKIEDLRPDDLPHGPVDLITAGCALHWADPLQITPSAAQLIKSGGTFAAWTYAAQPVPPACHAAAQKAFDSIFRRLVQLYEERIPTNGLYENLNARFDNIPFAPEEWENVRRIKIAPEVPMLAARPAAGEVRVLRDQESQEVLDDVSFISRKATYEWIVGYAQSLVPPIDVREHVAAEFEELHAAVGDSEIELTWPFALVLATRR